MSWNDRPRRPAGSSHGGEFTYRQNTRPASPLAPSTTTGADWPALDYEVRDWVPVGAFGVRASRGLAAGVVPYEAAVPPHIAGLRPALDPDTSAAAEEAAQELGRFDAELGARVAGFAPVLLRSEAASSSQIENLTASARAIFTAELGAKPGGNAGLIAANTRALQAALDLSDDVTADRIAGMHRALMAGQPRHTPGIYRQEQVWIGTRGNSPVGAEFVPPHHERVGELVEDLVVFARDWSVPSLVSVAIAHAQFETIHPYTDGNGRTGRALAQAMLRYRGVTRNVAVPVSAGLLADVEGYHRALTAYRQGDAAPIVRAFTDAAFRAVENSRTLVSEIDAIRADWDQRLKVRRDSNAWRLLDVIASRPVLDSRTAAEALGVKQPNAYPPLAALVEAGILKSKAEHKRGPFWRSDEILAAIDAFAERAGRRARN